MYANETCGRFNSVIASLRFTRAALFSQRIETGTICSNMTPMNFEKRTTKRILKTVKMYPIGKNPFVSFVSLFKNIVALLNLQTLQSILTDKENNQVTNIILLHATANCHGIIC